MMHSSDVVSIFFDDKIWALVTDCSKRGEDLEYFRGHIDTPIDKSKLHGIEYLIIGFALYEPQVSGDHTAWLEDCLRYCKESNMFPNLKAVYVLYESAYVNFSKLSDYYPVHGARVRYFLLRSDGTEEKSIGIDYSQQWIDNRNKKALWMIGDITNRPHKFPLLYKFFIENNLECLDYSLTYVLNIYQPDQFNEENFVKLLEYMNGIYRLDLDLSTMKDLYFSLARTFEGDQFSEMALKRINSFDLANYVFPPAYNEAAVVINPETWWRHPREGVYPEDSQIFPVTEKTWKPIAVKKPFIGISVNDTFDRTLESLGFRTFRKYTKHPELMSLGQGYQINEIEQYITVAYERVVSFLESCDENRQEIWKDIEHNHAQLKLVLEREWDLLFQSCPPLKHISREKILRLFVVAYFANINMNTQNPLTFGM
jgi:hypothetical protein